MGFNKLPGILLDSILKVWKQNYLKRSSDLFGCDKLKFHTSSAIWKTEDRKLMIKSLPKKDEGTLGENLIDIDVSSRNLNPFPTENTPSLLFNGVKFADVPVVFVKATKNNTKLHIVKEGKSAPGLYRTCGFEGFKKAKKGTNVAAQATAISFSGLLLESGIKSVRLVIAGLGPGRMSALRGLQLGGIDIISVTDATKINWHNIPRPKKRRRI